MIETLRIPNEQYNDILVDVWTPNSYERDEWIAWAKEDADKIKQEKIERGTHSFSLTNNDDLIGALGQYAIHYYLQGIGMGHLKISPYYVPGLSGDTSDLEAKGVHIDVKATWHRSEFDITRYTDSFVPLKKREGHEGKIDKYLFTRIEKDMSKVYIMGIIDYEKFWGNEYLRFDKPVRDEVQGFTKYVHQAWPERYTKRYMIVPTQFTFLYNLTYFRDWLY